MVDSCSVSIISRGNPCAKCICMGHPLGCPVDSYSGMPVILLLAHILRTVIAIPWAADAFAL